MRFLKICWVFSKYLVFYKFTKYRHDNFGYRLRRACEELGVIFIKIGQVLAMRYDLLPQEYCVELQKLLNSANPVEFSKIEEILDQEYGKPYLSVFREFSEHPLGSASVSQVHRAVLADGTQVAVKIKRPNVDRWFRSDIAIMRTLAKIAWLFSRILRRIQVIKLIDFFEDWISQDLDFAQEVRNIKKIREQYVFAAKPARGDLGRAIFIDTYDQYCTDNIVVMDFIDGVPLDRKAQLLADKNYDPQKSVKSFVTAAIYNWFRDDIDLFYFQADPHLSNLLALPGGDAANVDHGLIGVLNKREARLSRQLLMAVYMQDTDEVIKVAGEICGVSVERAKVLRPDIEKYLRRTPDEGFGFWFMEFGKIMVRHNFDFPIFLVTMGRAQLMLDGMVHEYLPGQTTLDILGTEFRSQAIKQVLKNIAGTDWLKLSYIISKKIQEAPKIVEQFLNNPLLEILSEVITAVKGAA